MASRRPNGAMRLVSLLVLGASVRVQGECDPSQGWLSCRRALVSAIFGAERSANGTALPSRAAPDYVIDESDTYEMRGWPAPGTGTGEPGGVAWKNGLKRLVWTLDSAVPGLNLSLNATVLWSFNTSGNAPANYPPPPDTPGAPTPSSPGYASYASRGDTLVLYHNGHETASCTPNYDGVVGWLNQLGYDAMELMMPLLGCNRATDRYPDATSHQWFEQWEQRGEPTIRYFLEPVVLAVNFAVAQGYRHVALLGLSGGGWTTTVAAAIDPRLTLSVPTAGSTPKFSSAYYPHWVPDLPEGQGKGEGGGGDYEQARARSIYDACDFTCMYVLGALEPGRAQLQLLHEHDSCCFAATGLHPDIARYNAYVQGQLRLSAAAAAAGSVTAGGSAVAAGGGAGWMQTAVTSGNYHEINYRDKVVVASLVERLRLNGGRVGKADLARLPFDLLQLQG